MDIVDWPESERDGYVLTPVNTVVNSFWCHILGLMADMAGALGNTNDASRYRTMATTATAALNAKLWNASTGLYVDGQTTTHSSLHANMFPLSFGLVPADRRRRSYRSFNRAAWPAASTAPSISWRGSIAAGRRTPRWR